MWPSNRSVCRLAVSHNYDKVEDHAAGGGDGDGDGLGVAMLEVVLVVVVTIVLFLTVMLFMMSKLHTWLYNRQIFCSQHRKAAVQHLLKFCFKSFVHCRRVIAL